MQIGIPGKVWATEYSGGWAVYAMNFGLVTMGLTLRQAEHVMEAINAALKTKER